MAPIADWRSRLRFASDPQNVIFRHFCNHFGHLWHQNTPNFTGNPMGRVPRPETAQNRPKIKNLGSNFFPPWGGGAHTRSRECQSEAVLAIFCELKSARRRSAAPAWGCEFARKSASPGPPGLRRLDLIILFPIFLRPWGRGLPLPYPSPGPPLPWINATFSRGTPLRRVQEASKRSRSWDHLPVLRPRCAQTRPRGLQEVPRRRPEAPRCRRDLPRTRPGPQK